MTVKELKDKLKQVPDDLEVFAMDNGWDIPPMKYETWASFDGQHTDNPRFLIWVMRHKL